jgi:hypothetical protein
VKWDHLLERRRGNSSSSSSSSSILMPAEQLPEGSNQLVKVFDATLCTMPL